MDSINAVTTAIQLSGTQMMGKTVMVQASQAERNETQTQQKQLQPTRLYIGGLHNNVTEQDVRGMFAEFGEVDFVDLHREPETGNSKGFAFVQFRDPEAAKRALVQVNGREMAGRTLKVGLVNTASGKGGVGPALGEIDEDGAGNLSLDAQSRAILMAKLQRTEDKSGSSTCLMLKHMFTTEDANDPNFEQELTEDIKEECSKHGQLRHMYIDRYNQNGVVYVRFAAVSQATAASNELQGRWFGGKQIEVQFVPEGTYLTKFPHAR